MSPPRRRSTEHRQNWIHQAHAYRTNPQPHLRLRAHPFSFTLGLRLERLLKVLGVDARFGAPRQSIFFGQQNTRRRRVGFRNNPNLDPGNTECVHGHQPESLLK
jgi:hypothetical protein